MSSLGDRIAKIETSKSAMQRIDVNKIHLQTVNNEIYPKFNPEIFTEDKDLIENIREVGLLQPLLVKRHAQLPDEFVVVSGHRRLQACGIVGIKKVECQISDPQSPEDIIALEMSVVLSNQTRDRSDPVILAKEVGFLEERLRAMKKINPDRFRGFTIRSQIAEALGVTERTVANVSKIKNNLEETDFAAFAAGKMTRKAALQKADENIAAVKLSTDADILNYEVASPTEQASIKQLLVSSILASRVLDRVEDKTEFLAAMKDTHAKSRPACSSVVTATFKAQFDMRGMNIKLASSEKPVRLTNSQIYQATAEEVKRLTPPIIEAEDVLEEPAAMDKKQPPKITKVRALQPSALITVLEACIVKIGTNPIIAADEETQRIIDSLVKRIEKVNQRS